MIARPSSAVGGGEFCLGFSPRTARAAITLAVSSGGGNLLTLAPQLPAGRVVHWGAVVGVWAAIAWVVGEVILYGLDRRYRTPAAMPTSTVPDAEASESVIDLSKSWRAAPDPDDDQGTPAHGPRRI